MNPKKTQIWFFSIVLILSTIWLIPFLAEPFVLGAMRETTLEYTWFMLSWIVFGTLFAISASIIINLKYKDKVAAFLDRLTLINDARWLFYLCFLALIATAEIRIFLYHGVSFIDDEFTYKFMAQQLMHGQLFTLAPKHHEFYSRPFIYVDEHKMYGGKFSGWPFLLMPFEFLKIDGFANCFYFAFTLPALYFLLKKYLGNIWAKLGSVVFLTTPAFFFAAGTYSPHISQIFVTFWSIFFLMKTTEVKSKWYYHFLFSFFYCLSFFIRPFEGFALLFPMFIFWLWFVCKSKKFFVPVVLCLVPILFFSSAFMYVNKVQTGSYFTASFLRYFAKEKEKKSIKKYKVTSAQHVNVRSALDIPVIFINKPSKIMQSVKTTSIGILRMNSTLFGWPISLLFILFAYSSEDLLSKFSLFLLLSLSVIFLFQFMEDPDTISKSHHYIFGIPFVILTISGVRNLFLQKKYRYKAIILLFIFILMNLCVYSVKRGASLNRFAIDIMQPEQILKNFNINNAVIFFKSDAGEGSNNIERQISCSANKNSYHFLFYPLVSYDPYFKNNVIWVKDLGLVENKKLLQDYPDRKGYLMYWGNQCTPSLTTIKK
ncbi:MAG: hypothetical protein A3F13_08780 [Gammaproteobacteria bacterium RIFCSPHIGHO2_12_FULL_40_19]|nr:MAG: hypothetical protein A3F13_08780 [Gammaproteobacteria bacterium RIFCSPHIGHO2_12_FULL_40_19]